MMKINEAPSFFLKHGAYAYKMSTNAGDRFEVFEELCEKYAPSFVVAAVSGDKTFI